MQRRRSATRATAGSSHCSTTLQPRRTDLTNMACGHSAANASAQHRVHTYATTGDTCDKRMSKEHRFDVMDATVV
eukprot:3284-Heterococcus_DN1.PRE.3